MALNGPLEAYHEHLGTTDIIAALHRIALRFSMCFRLTLVPVGAQGTYTVPSNVGATKHPHQWPFPPLSFSLDRSLLVSNACSQPCAMMTTSPHFIALLRIASHYFLSSTDTLDGFTTQKCFQLMFRTLAALQELQSSTKS